MEAACAGAHALDLVDHIGAFDDATEYGRWAIFPSTITPIVMYWPGSNGASWIG